MNNHRPRSLRREFRRWTLIRRARRLAFEREMADLDEFLARIKATEPTRPPFPREYADEESS